MADEDKPNISNAIRAYYFALAGAFGALTGWTMSTLLTVGMGAAPSVGKLVIYGGLTGLFVGLSLAVANILTSRGRKKDFARVLLVVVAGAVTGVVGIVVAQILFVKLGSGVTGSLQFIVSSLCWVLFGGLASLGSAVIRGREWWKSVLGGMTGGLVAGVILGIAGGLGIARNPLIEQIMLAVGFVALGAIVGIGVALIPRLIYRAWIKVIDGKHAGHIIDVTKYIDRRLGQHHSGTIGSLEQKAQVFIPFDKAVAPKHAEVKFADGGPMLQVLPEAADRITMVNGRRVAQHKLQDGDRLVIGRTKLLYRHEYK